MLAHLSVRLEESDAQGNTTRILRTLNATTQPRLLLEAGAEGYGVGWRIAEESLAAGGHFRIVVLAEGIELGRSDFDATVSDYLRTKIGFTLWIKFRVESGAVDRDANGIYDWEEGCPRGARAYYSFDDRSGGRATDFSGNGNHGTFIGNVLFDSTRRPNLDGNVASLDLDDYSEFVSVPASESLSFSGSFTIAAWVRHSSGTNILSKDNGSSGLTNYNLHVFQNRVTLAGALDDGQQTGGYLLATVGAVEAGTGFCDGGGCASVGADDFVDAAHPAGTWRHVIASWDNATKTQSTYLDCTLTGRMQLNTRGSPWTNNETMQIGQRKFAGGNIQGGVDEVRLYDRLMTESELADLCGGCR